MQIRDMLRDPRTVQINRLPAVSDHDCYRSLEEAGKQESSLTHLLNGRWKFAYAERLEDCPAGFFADGYDTGSWDEINVPGHIQLQGYGTPQYVNVQYPWDGHESLLPPAFPAKNPIGCYVRTFSVPLDWQDMDVLLTFHGVESVLACWVNGQFVGYSEDGFTPSRFDITAFLRPGSNTLAVQVFRYASCTWLEDQDFWRFSGIFRDVTLSALPKVHVEDLCIRTPLSERYTKAQVEAAVKLRLKADTKITVAARLLDAQGEDAAAPVAAESSEDTLHFVFDVAEPQLWSGESPCLYTLRITLADQEQVYEVVQTQVGLRQVEIREGVLLLNGRRLRLRGTNRHEFCAEAGRCITKEHMLEDIRQIKRSNINAVRTSHYPNSSLWYKLCDQYGIYLIGEANMETHGTWQTAGRYQGGPVPGDDPMWLPAVLDRANSMQQRDKNHPSVIIWSCGNESFGGSVIYEMSQQMRRTDPTRPVHYEGVANDRRYPDTTDIVSRMYTHAADVPSIIEQNPDKPFLLCEYAHAMGNSCGALHKYLALEEQYPQYIGAFVWDYVDQALWVTAPNGRKRLAYGGDFGDRPHDGEFCGNGLVFADRTPSPKLMEVRWQYQPVRILPGKGGVTLQNYALFTNTNRYDLRWKLLLDGVSVAQGSVEQPDVAPGREGFIALSLPPMEEAGEYVLSCGLYLRAATDWADTGFELMHGEAVVQEARRNPPEPLPVETVLTDYHLGITDDKIRLMLSMDSGLHSFRKRNGSEMLMTPPMLTLYRASTDNDRGCGGNQDDAFWIGSCLAARCRAVPVDGDDAQPVTSKQYRWELPFTGGAAADVTYTALGGGRLKVDLLYRGADRLPPLGAVGLSFRLPLAMNRVSYYGLGPQETYPDRKMGGKLALHHTTAQESYVPYLRPQECGSHEEVRYALITDEHGYGLRVDAAQTPFSLSVLPWSALEMTAALHPDELAQPTYTWLNIACCRRGVGGDDSWGSPVHPEYCLPSDKEYRLTFILSMAGE